MFYLEFYIVHSDPFAALIAFQQKGDLVEESKWQLAYLLFLWTTVFAVKWCYFAFFQPLLRTMAKGIIYCFWFSVGFSVVSWLFLVVGDRLIACRYLREEAGKHLALACEDLVNHITEKCLPQYLPHNRAFHVVFLDLYSAGWVYRPYRQAIAEPI